MSVKMQTSHMKALGDLLTKDLSDNHSDKKEFLQKGAVFLRTLAKDLEFKKYYVRINNAGISDSGDVCLYGMWGEGNGLLIELAQMNMIDACMMYRAISDIGGKKSGYNRFFPLTMLQTGEYNSLLRTFLVHRSQLLVVRRKAA